MGDTARLFEHDKTLKKELQIGWGWGAGVGGVGGWEIWRWGPRFASEKGLYLKNNWTKFKKWICFGISMNWGINLAFKKVKILKESKLEILDFGWNWLIFNKIWKIKTLGNEIKLKLFNPSIFVKKIKWARKWYNILSNTMFNKSY